MSNSLFISNVAQGGAGGAGGTGAVGGVGGAGQGGGLFTESYLSTSLTVTGSTVTLNRAIGGVGGAAGGTGGAGEGGGSSTPPRAGCRRHALISNSAILANAAEGGAGGTGGNGGDGLGGGIFNDQGATAAVAASVISPNLALGGLAAPAEA